MSDERNVETEESERAADRNLDRDVDRAEEDFEGHRMEVERLADEETDEAGRVEERHEERHID